MIDNLIHESNSTLSTDRKLKGFVMGRKTGLDAGPAGPDWARPASTGFTVFTARGCQVVVS